MPTFDIDSQATGGSFEPRSTDGWSVPIGVFAGIRFYLSYSVFVALAVLAGLVAMAHTQQGNHDLPIIAALGVAIWATGWLVQLIVHFCLHFGWNARSDSFTIGLLGIEVPNPLFRRFPWSPSSNLMAACFSLSSLMLFGGACLSIHMLTQTADYSSVSRWLNELANPSLGLDSIDNCYLSATWLFWIQAAFQAYPLPRNLGRGAIASVIALFSAEAPDAMQVRLLQRFLQMVALATFIVAMAVMFSGNESTLPRWPILVYLAILLWISANRQDLRDWITSLHLANTDPVAGHFAWHESSVALNRDDTSPKVQPASAASAWVSEVVDNVKMRQKRKRARDAMQKERMEAEDIARLDQILQIVSERGKDALSAEEAAILNRVSESLRKDRQSTP